MHCPLLTGKYMLYCTALKEGYVPSARELEDYCKQSLYCLCPLFVTHKQGSALQTA
ncbi:MAG: hypothetical protein WC539_09140 [Nitrospirota bacterium]